MARSQEDISEELDRSAPHWLRLDDLGAVMLEGLAAALAYVDQVREDRREQYFRQTAEGDHLDAIGDEVDVPRRPGEGDDDYRSRIVRHVHRGSVGHVLEECERILGWGGREAWRIEYREPLWDVADHGEVFADDPGSVAIGPDPPKYWGHLVFYMPDALELDDPAFADEGEAFADQDAYALDTTGDRQGRDVALLEDIIEENRPTGCRVLATFVYGHTVGPLHTAILAADDYEVGLI